MVIHDNMNMRMVSEHRSSSEEEAQERTTNTLSKIISMQWMFRLAVVEMVHLALSKAGGRR